MDVRILGSLEVRIDARPIDLGVRKARSCFAVLALSPNLPVRVDRLAALLWPDGAPARWENTIQSHISRLRSALEPERAPRAQSTRITTHGDAYVLHLADDELDARRFELLAADGRAALGRGEFELAVKLAGTALAEWHGPVLSDVSEASELTIEIARLDELRLIVAEERAEAQLALGHYADVITDLEALVHEHPLRERCWEMLLLALYGSGRQADALRRYQDVRSILVGELGIEPGPALRELEGSILRQELGDGGAVSLPTTITHPAPAAVALPAWLQDSADEFVGRSSERDVMVRAFERSREGTRRLVLIEGEPGIGKTRLVREACGEYANDALVLGGRCAEQPLHVLQPFAEAIGRFARADSDRLARLAPNDVAALATLVPELAAHASPLPAYDADAHRYLLFQAIANVLCENVAGRFVVLVLDDLQWASVAVLQLLSHLLREDERGGLLVVATARDTEPSDDVAALVADLHREQRVERITLAGLDRDEVAALIEARGADAPTDIVLTKTEGNPFYVEELVRHLDESGGALDADTVPDSVRDTIARRLLRLPDDVRRVLGIGAVAGAEFRLATVADAADMSVEDVDDAFALAGRAGIVNERTAAAGKYGFSHALMQTVLLEGLGSARRARLHRRIGDALAARHGDDTEIARHLLAAAADGSDPVPGVEVALRAADIAVERYTYDDAISLLTLARDALLRSDDIDPRLACTVEIALARALRNAGIYGDRDAVLERAWNHAYDVRDYEMLASVATEARSGTTMPSDHWNPRIEMIVDALDETSRGRLLAACLLAHNLSLQPGDGAREVAEWALARSAAFGPYERCVAYIHAMYALNATSPIERMVDLARGACVAAREVGSAAELVIALSLLRLAYLATGDLVHSDAVASQYEELVRAVRIPRYIAGVEQRRAMRALLAGRFTEAEAHAQQAYNTQPTDEYFEGLAVQLFAIYFEQGRLPEIRSTIEAWAEQYDRPAWNIGYATLLAEIGEHDAALAALGPFLDAGLRATVAADDLFFLSAAGAATAVARIGAPAQQYAPALYELLAPHASRVIVAAQGALCWGSIHRVLGPLAALMDAPDRAAVHFEAAMAVHERLGARPFLARDRLAYANMLAATHGDPVRIEQLQRTGRALARELGMRHLAG